MVADERDQQRGDVLEIGAGDGFAIGVGQFKIRGAGAQRQHGGGCQGHGKWMVFGSMVDGVKWAQNIWFELRGLRRLIKRIRVVSLGRDL
jgi:hypothetical protein